MKTRIVPSEEITPEKGLIARDYVPPSEPLQLPNLTPWQFDWLCMIAAAGHRGRVYHSVSEQALLDYELLVSVMITEDSGSYLGVRLTLLGCDLLDARARELQRLAKSGRAMIKAMNKKRR